MAKIEFFDVNCLLGRRNYHQDNYFWREEDLLVNLDRFGIKKALVYHSLTREHNPVVGNRVILEEITDRQKLMPVWGALPNSGLSGVDEMPALDDFIAGMKANNVTALRLFPDQSLHRFSLADWSLGDLWQRLNDLRIPVMVDFGRIFYGSEQIDYNQIYQICSRYRELPLILIGPDYRSCRQLFPLFKNCPNLKIEISRFMTHRGLEFVCQEFGPERLLFGSRLPWQNPGAVISMVLYARISQQEKELIAGRNLENMLAGVNW